MPAKPRYFITDVFTQQKYSGNQLATFINCDSLTSAEMLQIAKEINFSETTFITSTEQINGAYNVRIFTPQQEVPFAGHPTLGTACIIQQEILNNNGASNTIKINLPIGQIPVSYDQEADLYWMQQKNPQFGDTLNAADLAQILSIEIEDIDTRWPILEVSTGFAHIVVPMSSLQALKNIQVQRDKYNAAVQHAWAKIILAFSPQAYDVKHALAVRVFAGYYGVDEDAATGSGNGSLAAYLVKNRYFDSDSIDIKVGQGYEMQRPSELFLRADSSSDNTNIYVGGGVCRVAEGVWT